MLKTASNTISLTTRKIGTYEITDQVASFVKTSEIRTGTVNVFLQHTSASLVFFENADPSARRDLEAFLRRLVPEDADYFEHTLEGTDDMPSHLRMILTQTSLTVPIARGELQTGTWQGLFVYEHRREGAHRSLVLTCIGETG